MFTAKNGERDFPSPVDWCEKRQSCFGPIQCAQSAGWLSRLSVDTKLTKERYFAGGLHGDTGWASNCSHSVGFRKGPAELGAADHAFHCTSLKPGDLF